MLLGRVLGGGAAADSDEYRAYETFKQFVSPVKSIILANDIQNRRGVGFVHIAP